MRYLFLTFFCSAQLLFATNSIHVKESKLYDHLKQKAENFVSQNNNTELEKFFNKNKSIVSAKELDRIIKSLLSPIFSKHSKNYQQLKILYVNSSKKFKKNLKESLLSFLENPGLIETAKNNNTDLADLLLTLHSGKHLEPFVSSIEENPAQEYFEKNQNIAAIMSILEPHKVEGVKSGRQSLSIAAKNNSLPIIKILIEVGADLNHQDQWGWTALMYAAAGGFHVTVETLLEAGADTTIMNHWGDTAYTLAKDHEYKNVLSLLVPDYEPKEFKSLFIKKLSKEKLKELGKFNQANSLDIELSVFATILMAPVGIGSFARDIYRTNRKAHLGQLVQKCLSFLGLIISDQKNKKKEDLLEKFFTKYIKSRVKTKLSKKMVAAQIALAYYSGVYNFYMNKSGDCLRDYEKFYQSCELYQDPNLENELKPYGKKTKKIKYGCLSDSQSRVLFENGQLAQLPINL